MQGGSMSIKSTIAKLGLGHMIDQVYENPEEGMQTLLGWADKFSKGAYPTQRRIIREIVEDKENPYNPFIHKIFTDLDEDVVKKLQRKISMQYSLGDIAGPYQYLQSALHRMLGC